MKKIAVVGVPKSWSTEMLADEIEKKTGFRKIIDCQYLSCQYKNNSLVPSDHGYHELDAIIVKKISREYNYHMIDRMAMLQYLAESYQINVFSKPSNVLKLIDRLFCTLSLQQNNIPMPDTLVTEDINEALRFVIESGTVVLKPLFTSKARGMKVLQYDDATLSELKKFVDHGNQVLYLQKFLPIFELDLGVCFLGGEYLGTYARVKKEDAWNTTTESGGIYKKYEPSQEVIDIAYKAQNIFDLDFTCVDVVLSNDGPKVFEVSSFGGFRGLLTSHQINVAKLYCDYVLRRMQ